MTWVVALSNPAQFAIFMSQESLAGSQPCWQCRNASAPVELLGPLWITQSASNVLALIANTYLKS